MNMNETKKVNAKDFDWEAFKSRKIHIAMPSRQSVISTLRFLSEQGYVWGMSLTSLVEDKGMQEQLCSFADSYPVYIHCDGLVRNGILRDFVLPVDTDATVEIDFEEEREMTTFEKVNAKDFDWEVFRKDRVVIAVDNRYMTNLNKVTKLLNDAGYYWADGTPVPAKHAQGYKAITDGSHSHITYLSTNGCENDRSVYWSTGYNECERPVKIVFNERACDDKIVITTDGKITTATLYSNGKKTGIGTAVCHDCDKFDIYAGAKLALERLEKYKKDAEMTDWEKFVKGYTNLRIPKKHIRSFLERAAKDGLKILVTMADWCLGCLEQDGDSIVVFVDHETTKNILLTEALRTNRSRTVDYFPGMK